MANEAPNTLRSQDRARILDLVSEGPIVGLVDGKKSVYFNDVPVMDSDGALNFEGITVDTRTGEQGQDYISGFEGSESEIAVQTEMLANIWVTRSVSSVSANALRVRIQVPALRVTDSGSGDTRGTSVTIVVQTQSPGGSWRQAVRDTISGKTSSAYVRSYRVELTGSGEHMVRVMRITPDSHSLYVENKTFWASYTEIIDDKFSYPNSALVATSYDSSKFQNLPTRSFDLKGLIIQVPSNYDPELRQYAGIWDGTFKSAWTDNPAWVYYALATNKRWGLGKYLGPERVNKWDLYQVSQYCDELVSNGFGGTEPRYTCNLYLQADAEAFKVMQDLASLFWGMSYWSNSRLSMSQDSPRDAEAIFTRANVVDGKFEYVGASLSQRHTVCKVVWNNPDLSYQQDIEYVYDEQGVADWGIREVQISAIGCTSRGQAHRAGRRLLYTEAMQSEVVTMKVGIDSAFLRPGAIIQVCDPTRMGSRNGGRIASATTSTLTLDQYRPLGGTEMISVMVPSGKMERARVVQVDGNVLTLYQPLSDVPVANAIWAMSSDIGGESLWQVTATKEEAGLQFSVSAILHDPRKYSMVDEGIKFDAPHKAYGTSVFVQKPGAITFGERVVNLSGYENTIIDVNWADVAGAGEYTVRYRLDLGNWTTTTTQQSMLEIPNLSAGDLEVQVFAVGALNVSAPSLSTYTVGALGNAPSEIYDLALAQPFVDKDAYFSWGEIYRADHYEVFIYTPDGHPVSQVATKEAKFTYSLEANIAEGGPRRSFRIDVRAVTLYGVPAGWASMIVANPPPAPPTGIRISAGFGSMTGVWDSAPETDASGYLIHVSKTQNFIPSPDNLLLDTDANALAAYLDPQGDTFIVGGTYYFRLATYDKFGKSGLNYSGEIVVEMMAVPQTLIDLNNLGPSVFDPATALAVSDMQLLAGADMAALKAISISTIPGIDAKLNAVEAAVAIGNVAVQTKLDAASATILDAQATAQELARSHLYALTVQSQESKTRRGNVAEVKNEVQQAVSAVESVASSVTTLTARLNNAEASVVSASLTLANTTSSLASRIDSLVAAFNNNTASATSELSALSTETTALGQRIDTLTATVGSSSSSVASTLSSLATQDTALGQRIDSLGASVGESIANAVSQMSAYADTDSATSKKLDALTVTVAGNKSDTETALQAYADADTALAQRVDTLTTTVGSNAASTSSTISALANGQEATARRIDGIEATVGANSSSVAGSLQAYADADTALGQRIDSVSSVVGGNRADAELQQVALSNADTALGQRIDTLRAAVIAAGSSSSAAITQEAASRATQDTALSDRISSLTATVESDRAALAAQIDQAVVAQVNGDSANASAVTSLSTAFTSYQTAMNSQVSQVAQAVTDASGATAQSLESMGARLDTGDIAQALGATISRFSEVDAAISGKVSAADVTTLATQAVNGSSLVTEMATSISGLKSEWSVAVSTDAYGNKKVAGVRLYGDATTTAFDIVADVFRVSLPDGTGTKQVFVAGVVNGAPSIGINGDLYVDGTIQGRAVAANSITAGHLAVTSLDAISATIGHFRSASSGRRLEIQDGLLQVYDGNNVLRVRLGVW